MENEIQVWKKEIHAGKKYGGLGLKNIFDYRDLVLLFVRRNFKVLYQQTALGAVWILLKPLLTTVVFTIVFGGIIQVSTDGVPQFLFFLLGTSLWSLFSSNVNEISASLIQNAGLLSKVYFPRLVVPVSSTITGLFSFLIQFGLFAVVWTVYVATGSVAPNYLYILLFPVSVLLIVLLGFGVGLSVSALTTRYRDLQVAVGFFLQLWMFITPVVYPISEVTGVLRVVMLINPMAPIIEAMRFAFLGSGVIPWSYLGLSAAVSFFFALLGLLLFRRIENNFIDTI